ncbi:MAG: VanZ family protein [Limnobacter sp.]|uniref:VanZ family protein n=1 Tax=Limnobacter sp. TaxID=2003368 RepID=UPI003919803A
MPTPDRRQPLIQDALRTTNPHRGLLIFACVYACLVVHLSLFPYVNWRSIGIGPFEFVLGPWVPIHQTLLWADIIVNVAGYLPLGFCLALGTSRSVRSRDVLLVGVVCLGLSFSVEALQTYLPTRVPSKMDVLTNVMGGVLGALLAVALTARNPWVAGLNRRLESWLIDRAWLGALLLVLWFLAILPPQNPPFSMGFWLGNLFDIPGPQIQSTPFGLPASFILQVEQWAPNVLNYCWLMCAWLIGLAQTQSGSPRLRMVLVLIAITVLLRSLEGLILFPVDAWVYQSGLWLGAHGAGLFLAVLAAVAVSFERLAPHHLARLSLLHLVVGWSLTLLLPGVYDPDLTVRGPGWIGLFRSLQEAGRWISELWPILALTILIFLSRPEARFRR